MEFKKKRRTLVLGVGGLYGAYDAGVCVGLLKNLGPDYFDEIYAVSAGVYNAAFYLSNQPDVIENVWKNLVCGRQLVSLLNPFKGKPVMNLNYLINLFQSPGTALNIDRVFASSTKLQYTLIKLETLEPVYVSPNSSNIFTSMKASCALPLAFGPVEFEGSWYLDWATLTVPVPIDRALASNPDEVIVIYNRPGGKHKESLRNERHRYYFFRFLLAFLPDYCRPFGFPVKTFNRGLNHVEDIFVSDPRVKVIRPNEVLPLRSILDTNKRRLSSTFEAGRSDAERFLNSYID